MALSGFGAATGVGAVFCDVFICLADVEPVDV